ncbi:MAG: signal recognition particle-docking protein FtsY, partial [Methanosarcinales archaeon]|nr:signal recognition particle-docking protein FtsY [Methanosarcinales archaeon]
MFGKLKEKLASFTRSLDKTVEEKAVELEEPEVIVKEEITVEADAAAVGADTVVNAEDAEAAAEGTAGKFEGKEPEAAETKESGADGAAEGMIKEKEPVSAGAGSPETPAASVFSSPAVSSAQVQAEPKKEKAGFFGKAKALIFDREVILDEGDLEGPLAELEIALLESDLALSVTDAIVASVREQLSGTRKRIGKNTGSIVEDALKNAILEVMSANVFDFDEFMEVRHGQTVHIAFVGINGTGKTTSIAKIANRLQKNGYSITIAAGDTFRAGAIDQIQIHADRLGIKVIKHQEGSDPAAVIYDALQYSKAHKSDVLLSDTAGRMHTNVNLMAQLEKICRVSTPDLIIFVDEATAGNDAVERASQFNGAVPISGTILTKLDADSKGGAAISSAYITQKPILF